ncbi:hypothetical protein [Actinoplanes sp. NPDC049265]|uniref:hypothetical protein n=1 Tax=Actinoplanes sp. NPDC049265 TaxID=3363902 RepID=UPI00371D2E72
MTYLAPIMALAGVIVGGCLSIMMTLTVERKREHWNLAREWRERKLQAYGTYLADVKRLRDLAERVAASVGLDDQAPPLGRDAGLEQMAEANMARSVSFETVNLVGGRPVVEAGRLLNRAVWRLEWFARGLLDDSDREGWIHAFRSYHAAINVFTECSRLDVDVSGEFSPRVTEPSPRVQYESDRAGRDSATVHPD